MRAPVFASLLACLVCMDARASGAGLAAGGGQPESAGTPPGPGRAVMARLADNHLEIRDARTGEPLMLSRGAPLVSGLGQGVTYAVKLKDHPDGADLVFNFMNSASEPRPLGAIVLGTFTLGPSITYYDLRDTCQGVAVDYHTYLPKSVSYPGELYSPAWVMASDLFAIGVSLQYPVMEYRHDARLCLSSPSLEEPGIEGGRGWVTTFQFNDTGTPPGFSGTLPKVQYPAMIRPGEVQTYTVNIRVTAKAAEWVRTLLPYRDFFRATYGGVRYLRRTDPVQAVMLAEEGMLTDDSPAGFVEPFRPDVHGWSRLSRYLRSENGDFNRAVLVNPAGLYRQNRQHNPPFQIASTWAAGPPPLATATERYDGLPAVTTAGGDLGLWWGNSCRVMRSWDTAGAEALDPANPEHSALALAELEAGVRAGASTVVLGNFRHEITPLWTLSQWLGDLIARYPEVRFVTDPSACDVLHGLAPTFVKGWNDTTTARREADLYSIKGPNTLADFLLPGHETWAGFTYDNPKQPMKVFLDAPRARADMERYAAFGYVPCFFWLGKLEGTIAAAPSWTASIPADLLLSDSPQPLGPGTPFDMAATEPPAAPAKSLTDSGTGLVAPGAPAAATPVPRKGPPLPKGGKVSVHAAPGTVKTAPNEGEMRPDQGEAKQALRRAGATSANAATKASKIGPTKVAPSEEPPKKPD